MTSQSGHDNHVYDKADVVALADAKARFDALLKRGHLAAKDSGGSHVQIRAFDPEADKITFVPPVVGG
jgi:hypothetical protein